jgi:hypothetical protein
MLRVHHAECHKQAHSVSVVMQNVVMLNVMAPLVRPLCLYKKVFQH